MHTLQAQSLSDRLELLSPEAHAGSSGATLDISLLFRQIVTKLGLYRMFMFARRTFGCNLPSACR